MLQSAVNPRSSDILDGKNEFVQECMYTGHTKTSVSVIFALPLDVNQMTKAAKMKINKFSDVPFKTLLAILCYAVIFVNYQSL